MTAPDTSSWNQVGRTSNSGFYLVESGILASVVDTGSIDVEETALENVQTCNGYFREHGPGALLVFIEGVVSQDRAARRVYQHKLAPHLVLGAALVGGTLLSRAMASFFFGLSRPKLEFRMYPRIEDAMPWLRELVRANCIEEPV